MRDFSQMTPFYGHEQRDGGPSRKPYLDNGMHWKSMFNDSNKGFNFAKQIYLYHATMTVLIQKYVWWYQPIISLKVKVEL